jgi:hypothetical protein
VVFVDAKGTEPTLAGELIAAYAAGAGFVPRVKLWPAEPLSGWEGDPMELANRLLAVQDWSEPWYERVASRAIRLACGADIGPPRSAEELLARLTAPGLEQLYAGTDRAELVRQLTAAKGFEGAALRYGDFFEALAGRFDGAWSYDDADLGFLSLPVLAAREDASAAFRLLLEDLGHYGVARKDRDDQGMTVYLGGVLRRQRRRPSRDRPGRAAPGCRGRGGVRRPVLRRPRGRTPGSPAARQLGRAHRPQDAPTGAAPGRRRDHLDPGADLAARPVGPDGHASLRMAQRPLVDPDAVRRAGVGEAWIIAAGRSLHLQVAETPYAPQPAELPAPHRDGLAVVEERPPWVVDLPDQEPTTATVVAGELPPPRPSLPPPSPELPRLRLQLATAVREGDELALRRVLKRAARVAPTWDAQAELAELTAARRRRRRNQPPAWRGWLTRIAHPRRTRP